jgi:PAS domain S-box-containing protein
VFAGSSLGDNLCVEFCVDIADRKRAEEAVRENERQFRLLADSISNLAWWANGDGYITWYNRRWYEYTGTTPEEMEGWGWQRVHDPQMLPAVLERWRSSIATGEPFEMEFPLRAADGNFRWFLTRIMPLKDSAGKVQRWFGTNTDISEAREAREVLTRSKAELERLVEERTAKLQELVGELEHFSYSIIHDMRAPLRAMQGFAELLEETTTVGRESDAREYLSRIKNAAARMDLLITDALDYNRAVRKELVLTPVDPGALLREILASYPEFQSAKAQIEIAAPLPWVLGNQTGLTQCFSNLLGNAAKFVKAGQMPQIRVWAESANGWVRLCVEDRGIGIPVAMQPRIFDMFSRGHQDYPGTGIGLALVRKVMERMGGKVTVESEEGKGSRFWLSLKAAEEAPKP